MEDACAICMSSEGPPSTWWAWPACGHQFHRICIARWRGQDVRCPMCRQEIPQWFVPEVNDQYMLACLAMCVGELSGDDIESDSSGDSDATEVVLVPPVVVRCHSRLGPPPDFVQLDDHRTYFSASADEWQCLTCMTSLRQQDLHRKIPLFERKPICLVHGTMSYVVCLCTNLWGFCCIRPYMLDVPEVIDDCPVVQGGFTLDVPLDDIEPITPPDDIELVLDHNTADDIELEMNKEPEVDDTVVELMLSWTQPQNLKVVSPTLILMSTSVLSLHSFCRSSIDVTPMP